MLTSVIGMTSLFSWCIYRVLTQKKTEKQLHASADIDPQDG